MLGIKIRDTFISLNPDTTLTFEMSHPVGIITDALDQVNGGFSFPIEIPLDDVNLGVIGHAQRLDLDSVLIKDEYCEVWIDGVLLYIGLAYVKAVSRTTCSLYMVFNDITPIADVLLSELDLGGTRTLGASEAVRTALADDTAANPLDHDFIFCPVYNPVYSELWNTAFPTAQQTFYQNFYSSDDAAYAEYPACAITPFVRLDYILRQIFAHSGYSLDNQWQDIDELKLILIYNNFNINTHTAPAVSSWDEEIDLAYHVPYRKALDLVKAVIGTFALGLYTDPHDKTVELIPWRDLISGPVVADWTSKAAADYDYTTDRDYISRWRYDLDEADAMSVRFSGVTFPQDLVLDTHTYIRQALAGVYFVGVHYAIADNTYYWLESGRAAYTAQDFKEQNNGSTAKEYISPLIPMWNSHDIETDGDVNDALVLQQQQLPAIEHVGYSSQYADMKTTCTSMRLMIYRGMQPYDTGISGTYPMAGVTRYNIRGDVVGEYALTWDQPGGIYDQWWKLPYEMLLNRKSVVRRLRLTIADLVSFRFQHKIRIENQNYFMLKFRFNVSSAGLSPIEATMMTTL